MSAFPLSNSYDARVQSFGAMKRSLPLSRHARDLDARRHAGRQRLPAATQATSAFPQPGAMMAEIGVILAGHLAVAIVVTLALRVFGIA